MNTVRDPSPLPREHVRSTRADPGLHMHVRLIQTRPPQRVFILDTRYSILDTRYSILRTSIRSFELSIVSLVMRISLTPNLRCLRLGWNHSCEIGLHSTIRLLVVAAIASCVLKDVSAPRLPKKLWVGPGTYILHRAHIIVTLLHSVRIMPFRLYTC
jgi:hypothetical protein